MGLLFQDCFASLSIFGVLQNTLFGSHLLAIVNPNTPPTSVMPKDKKFAAFDAYSPAEAGQILCGHRLGEGGFAGGTAPAAGTAASDRDEETQAKESNGFPAFYLCTG